jgi:hypothetical protein
MNTFGRAARRNNSFVAVTVAEALCASNGETSIDNPAVYSICAIVCWPKQVGSMCNVLERQVEENRLSFFPAEGLLSDRGVISRTVLDVVVENFGIGRESGHRELIDVTSKCPTGQKIARNVVEPEALSKVIKFLLHSCC